MKSSSIEAAESANSGSSLNVEMCEMLKAPRVCFKIAGIYVERADRQSRCFFICHWCYCIVFICFYLADAVRYMFIFQQQDLYRVSDRLMGVCAMAVFSWMLPFTSIINLYTLYRHLPELLKGTMEYHQEFRKFLDPLQVKRRIKKVILFNVLCAISATLITGLLLGFLPEDTLYLTSLVLLPRKTSTEKLLSITLQCIKVFMGSFMLLSIAGFCFKMCLMLKKEYTLLTERLQHILQLNSDGDIEDSMEGIRHQHETITKLCSTANPLLQQVVFTSYASGIPVVCFVIYGLIHRSLLIFDFLALLEIFTSTSIFMLFTTMAAGKINSAAHEIGDLLFQIDLRTLSERTIRQISVFIARVNGPPIGVSVYGLFVVDSSTKLMLFGTILTYSIVVLQLPGGSTVNSCGNGESSRWSSLNNDTMVNVSMHGL